MNNRLKTIMGASMVTATIGATGFFYNFGYALSTSVYRNDNFSVMTKEELTDVTSRINGYKAAAIPFGVVAAISSLILMKTGEKRLKLLEAVPET
jgi:hypothetical protein